MPTTNYDTIIFDLGGVLIDWNPHHLFKKIIPNEEKRNWFLNEVCTPDWNIEQDAGRSLAEATEVLTEIHPEYSEWIKAYYDRWEEMLGGPIQETVDLLSELRQDGVYRLLALTNWSAETFPIAQERYDFLQWFEGILVSGVEKMKKPDAEIYDLIVKRYNVVPDRAVFIDDSLKNVHGAAEYGITSIQFHSTAQLRQDLRGLNLQVKL